MASLSAKSSVVGFQFNIISSGQTSSSSFRVVVVLFIIIIIIIVLSSYSCERKTVKTVANVHLLYPRLQEYITVSDVVTGIGVITLVYYPSLVFLAWFRMTNLSISASRYGISLRGNLSDAKKRRGNHEMANSLLGSAQKKGPIRRGLEPRSRR